MLRTVAVVPLQEPPECSEAEKRGSSAADSDKMKFISRGPINRSAPVAAGGPASDTITCSSTVKTAFLNF